MSLPSVAIRQQDINILLSPKEYQQTLLTLIAQAKKRIYITLLYLENDEAGNIIFEALYQAKQKTPQLNVVVFVDAHRAQRGLIGQKQQLGNRAMYVDFAQKHQGKLNVFGIAVKPKELLGVLHLKGMVFDDEVLYSGASINNVYLHHGDKYRLDRYYQISSSVLADSFCDFLNIHFIDSDVAINFSTVQIDSTKKQRLKSKRTTTIVKKARYSLSKNDHDKILDEPHLKITPLAGCGKWKNQLNQTILKLLKEAEQEIIIFTPYFNFPRVVIKQINLALKRGVNITLIVGDKTASDFYIKAPENFSTIGIIPYIYEQILQRFVKRWQSYIKAGQLTIRLWKDGDNSYHLKGVIVDSQYHLLTGSNLNPRAWGLDLENGLLIEDNSQLLMPDFRKEFAVICKQSEKLAHYSQLDTLGDYPIKPRKILRRLKISQIDRVLKRFL